jgi:DNA-binding GntR family transcriptional regulator
VILKALIMTASPWPVIAAQSVTDRVYEAIRERIIRGELAAGSFVRQDELSQAMGVSRTPIREALMRLVSDGYVERVHRRGFRIAEESVRDLLALYPIISALEVLACRIAFPLLDASDHAELKRIDRDFRKANFQGDAKMAIQLNQAFHHQLAVKCGNGRLLEMLNQLGAEISRLEIWSFSDQRDREQTMQDHAAIIKALERGRTEQALSLLERDRMSAYHEFLEHVEHRAPDGQAKGGRVPKRAG